MMQTKEQVTQAFTNDLQAVLDKYGVNKTEFAGTPKWYVGSDGIKRWLSNDQPCDKVQVMWRCTQCGKIDLVGRCCGFETRKPVEIKLPDVSYPNNSVKSDIEEPSRSSEKLLGDIISMLDAVVRALDTINEGLGIGSGKHKE
jgi:hypothetical protein